MRYPGAELLAATVIIETSPVEVVATQGLVVAVPARDEPIVALETVEIRQVGVAQGKAAARGEVAEHRVEVAMVPLEAAATPGMLEARLIAVPVAAQKKVAEHRVEVAMVPLEAAAQGRVEATAAPGEPVPRVRIETRLAVALAARKILVVAMLEMTGMELAVVPAVPVSAELRSTKKVAVAQSVLP